MRSTAYQRPPAAQAGQLGSPFNNAVALSTNAQVPEGLFVVEGRWLGGYRVDGAVSSAVDPASLADMSPHFFTEAVASVAVLDSDGNAGGLMCSVVGDRGSTVVGTYDGTRFTPLAAHRTDPRSTGYGGRRGYVGVSSLRIASSSEMIVCARQHYCDLLVYDTERVDAGVVSRMHLTQPPTCMCVLPCGVVSSGETTMAVSQGQIVSLHDLRMGGVSSGGSAGRILTQHPMYACATDRCGDATTRTPLVVGGADRTVTVYDVRNLRNKLLSHTHVTKHAILGLSVSPSTAGVVHVTSWDGEYTAKNIGGLGESSAQEPRGTKRDRGIPANNGGAGASERQVASAAGASAGETSKQQHLGCGDAVVSQMHVTRCDGSGWASSVAVNDRWIAMRSATAVYAAPHA